MHGGDNVNILGFADDGEGDAVNSSRRDVSGTEWGSDVELHIGNEFDSHEAAYSFYQEYAKMMGFTTSIKNSRRSKKSKEFIDAKFACSRYGVTPESDGFNGRRQSVKKTDCKASLHVKKRSNGKWFIHEFIKEHNHELLPALSYHFQVYRNNKFSEKNNIDILHAVSERTRKTYVEMSKQCGGYRNIGLPRSDPNCHFDKGHYLLLQEGDAPILLEYFKHMQKESPGFFYAMDLNEEQRLRNLFWVDSKSRKDYVSFCDVISFDTTYFKNDEKIPLVLFTGVNNHFQSMLFGCALVADESKSTFVWLMRTWLRAMGGPAPKVILTDHDSTLKAAVREVFPNSRHCFPLWHVLEKIPENLAFVIKRHEHFAAKFQKSIFKSWADEDFDLRWWKMVGRFELHEDEWVQSLYEDREKWVPTYMKDVFLAGMSTTQRSESLNSFFDKYIHKKITLKEFVKQYGLMLQDRHDEEAIADFDTSHKQPALKSPSPWEKQMSAIYTHAIFKKFQVEVLGVVGCHFKERSEEGMTKTFEVDDCEKAEKFVVSWDETKSEVSCLCHSFEYKGFLCRHAMIVLQICGLTSIPSHYILKRWTKDAKSKQSMIEGREHIKTGVQRYNDLCKQAIELSEVGSLSQESYSIAFRALVDALKNCVNVNDRGNTEYSCDGLGLHEVEEVSHVSVTTSAAKKKTNRKRKVQSETNVMLLEAQDSLQQIDNLSSDGLSLNGYYDTQQGVQGMVQLNLMEPPRDVYYNQPTMQGLGQLSSLNPITATHDGFFGAHQTLPGLGNLDFRPSTSFGYSLQDDPGLRSAELSDSAARHG